MAAHPTLSPFCSFSSPSGSLGFTLRPASRYRLAPTLARVSISRRPFNDDQDQAGRVAAYPHGVL